MPFSNYRNQFTFTHDKVYINHASLSPLSLDVRDKMDWFINNRSFGEIKFYDEMVEIGEQLRQNLGKMLHAPAENIAFTSNTSHGLNILAQGIEWQKGDEIIIVKDSFPAMVYPFDNLKEQGVKIVWAQNKEGFADAATLEKCISAQTRMIVVSFVHYHTGYRSDLLEIGALCKHRNLIYCVDAIQGLGVMPIDVTACHIDFLSSGGHKWLMGPMGTGLCYIAPRIFEKVKVSYAGWLGVDSSWQDKKLVYDMHGDARRFEFATKNYLGICGLSASVEMLLKVGTKAIEQHLLILGAILVEKLTDLGLTFLGHKDSYYWSGVYTFEHPDAEELFIYLNKHKVICTARHGALRFAPHFYNTREDIMQVVELIARFVREHA